MKNMRAKYGIVCFFAYFIFFILSIVILFSFILAPFYRQYTTYAVQTAPIVALVYTLASTVVSPRTMAKNLLVPALIFIVCPFASLFPVLLFVDTLYTHRGILGTMASFSYIPLVWPVMYLIWLAITLYPGVKIARAIARRFYPVPPATEEEPEEKAPVLSAQDIAARQEAEALRERIERRAQAK